MNTFLPYPDMERSIRALDKRRCWKQCLEAKQLLEGKWPHHPASKMWRGYSDALTAYFNWCYYICVEVHGIQIRAFNQLTHGPICLPPWFGDEAFHASHRSNLRRKDPIYYQFPEPPNLPYIWPKVQQL